MKRLAEVVTNLLADAVDPELRVTGSAESDEMVRLVEPLERQGKHTLLGQVHETVGLIDIMIEKARPDLGLDGLLMGIWSLNVAAHSYRKAGKHELARIVGQRALWEFNQLVVDGELRTDRCYEPVRIWYVLEMMGDASVCADPPKARQFYEAAKAGFAQMDDMEQMSEGTEIFPGYYLTHFETHFMAMDDRLQSRGVETVEAKMKLWA